MGFSEVTQMPYRIFFESFLKLNNSVAIFLCFDGAKVIFAECDFSLWQRTKEKTVNEYAIAYIFLPL